MFIIAIISIVIIVALAAALRRANSRTEELRGYLRDAEAREKAHHKWNRARCEKRGTGCIDIEGIVPLPVFFAAEGWDKYVSEPQHRVYWRKEDMMLQVDLETGVWTGAVYNGDWNSEIFSLVRGLSSAELKSHK